MIVCDPKASPYIKIGNRDAKGLQHSNQLPDAVQGAYERGNLRNLGSDMATDADDFHI